jgi:hypothetical protein
MSEFTNTALFEAAAQASDAWSSLPNVLEESSSTSAWSANASMSLTNPLNNYPGGEPILPSITINNVTVSIRWRRGGDVGSGGTVRGYFRVGAAPEVPLFSIFGDSSPYQTDERGGDAVYWGLTDQELIDFLEGNLDLNLRFSNSGVNGSAQKIVQWVKVTVQYTYTGSGSKCPIRF